MLVVFLSLCKLAAVSLVNGMRCHYVVRKLSLRTAVLFDDAAECATCLQICCRLIVSYEYELFVLFNRFLLQD